jgi:hypothetical protein
MPKDPTKNIDRYKIGGGMLNEFEFQKIQQEFSERNDLDQDNFIPGTSAEANVQEITTAADEPTAPMETPGAAPRRPSGKKRPASKKTTKKAAAKKTTKKAAAKKTTKKAAGKKGTKKAAGKSTKKAAGKKGTKKAASKK